MLPRDEWETYGADDSRLPMSGMSSYTPGMEITGGSLGQGMSVAVGMCLGLKRKTSRSFVYNLMSDGEINEGATWEAALSASHWRLDNLIVLVDVNNQQADGASQSVLQFEPLEEKWKAFGWFAQRVDGNDIEALVVAFDRARDFAEARPRVIVCDTLMGKGVPLLETREKTHFIRVEPEEWRIALDQLTAGSGATRFLHAGQAAGGNCPRLTTSAMIASIAAEGQRTRPAPFGHALAALAAERPEIVGLTADLGQIHRPPRLRRGLSGPVLPDGDGRAAADGRGCRYGARRLHPLRHHLCGVRVASRLRLHLPRDRGGSAEREDRLCAAWTDDRLRAEPPGDRRSGDLPRHAEPDDH